MPLVPAAAAAPSFIIIINDDDDDPGITNTGCAAGPSAARWSHIKMQALLFFLPPFPSRALFLLEPTWLS